MHETGTDPVPLPVPVAGVSNIVAIAAGPLHSLALRDDGRVWAWGFNDKGQLGDGTTTDQARPIQVTGMALKQLVSETKFHVCWLGIEHVTRSKRGR